MTTPKKAIDLILNAEGIDQPSQWPGGESGITIGYGYDLGYEENFAHDWGGYITPTQIETLKIALGKKGEAARNIAHAFSAITISQDAALNVFLDATLPRYEKMTVDAFPGIDKFPQLAFGALVSLVFNRGSSMNGDRRSEMRAIREATQNYRDGHVDLKDALTSIARNLRSMKRLWIGKNLSGLISRREAEAKLVEEAIPA